MDTQDQISSQISSISSQLDQLLIEFMEKAEFYQQLQQKAAERMTSGYLALAKARINTGGFEMNPIATIEPTVAVTCDFIPNKDQKDPSNENVQGRYSHQKTSFSPALVNPQNSNPESVLSSSSSPRRRIGQESKETVEKDTKLPLDSEKDSKEQSNNDSKEQKRARDPLQIFNFMSRHALKPAQNHFNNVVPIIIESADAVQELLEIERKYMALKQEKQKLTSSVH